MIRGEPLDRGTDDVARALLGVVLRPGLDIANHYRGVMPRLLLHAFQQQGLGLIHGHAGNPFQLLHALCHHLV